MSNLRHAVVGDVNDVRTVRLDGIGSLVGAQSVTVHVWDGDDRTAIPAEVVDAQERTVSFSLGGDGGWLASRPLRRQTWQVSFWVWFNDGTRLTFPARKPMTLQVRPNGAPLPAE